jgi:hypothetical protein
VPIQGDDLILRFLRCFSAFRRLEEDLAEARTEVGICRDRAMRAEREAEKADARFEKAYEGQVDAHKMLTNIAVQVHIGCPPPHPEVFSLPARKPKQVDYTPIETGRVPVTDVVRSKKRQFAEDLEEFFKQQKSAS